MAFSWEPLQQGFNNTGRAPVGIFADNPVSIPKYSLGNGPRGAAYAETLARMYIPTATDAERTAIVASVAQAGDPTSGALAQAIMSNFGYVDFLLQRVSHPIAEKAEVIETLDDSSVAYFFGSAASTFSYAGVVINSQQDDQAVNLFRIYRDIIRGSQLARRQKRVSLIYDSYIVSGAVLNLQEDFNAENEMVVGFSFSLLVESIVARQNPKSGILQLAGDLNFLKDVPVVSDFTPPVTSTRLVVLPLPGSVASIAPPTATTLETPVTDQTLNDTPVLLPQTTGFSVSTMSPLNVWADPDTHVVYGDPGGTQVLNGP